MELIYIIHASRKSTGCQLSAYTKNLLRAYRVMLQLRNQGFKFIYLYTNTPEQAEEEIRRDCLKLDENLY